MDDLPAPDALDSQRTGHRLPVNRAVILLGLFVLATVLLLGKIHNSPATPSASGSATTTTTSKPPTTTTTTTNPASAYAAMPVLVANASGVNGAAAAVSSRLQGAGWNMQAPTNATAQVTTSAVYYVAGRKTPAADIAADLQIPSADVLPYTTAAPVSTMGTAEVLVVVAQALATSATATTSTT